MVDPKSVLITGAARGIGAALAKAYSAPGVSIFLSDIRAEKLENVRSECQGLGAQAHCRVVDVTDAAAMEDWITEADSISPLDLVFANAATSYGNSKKDETADEIRSVFSVNVDGMLNTVLPVLPLFRNRKRGRIALMSSLAGFRGFPHSPSYCATKAAVRVFGQGLQARVKREGVSVSVVIPAFVITPMTDGNLFNMPGIIKADRAARIIKRKLARGKSEFVFPRPYPAVAWFLSFVAPSLMARFTALK